MAEEFRLILDGDENPYWNMAVDEAIMRLMPQKRVYTLRFYGWKPSAVSIGYFQSLRQVVDIDYAKRNGIAYVRRITGGGAVYHSTEGEVTYSIIVPQDYPRLPRKVLDSYFFLCGGIVRGLREMGFHAEFAPVNDIVIDGKKISGNAQTRRGGTVLQHGTVLVDVSPEVMFSVLRVSDEKIRDKMIKSIYDRVTSLRHMGYEGTKAEVIEHLRHGFEEEMDIVLREGKLDEDEISLARELMETKYSTDEWNFRR